jgi:branched-chain amino acid transport system substrate-binding protein
VGTPEIFHRTVAVYLLKGGGGTQHGKLASITHGDKPFKQEDLDMKKCNSALRAMLASAVVLSLMFLLPGRSLQAKNLGSVNVGCSHGLTGAVSLAHTAYMEAMISYFKDLNDKGGIKYNDPKTGKVEHVDINFIWADDGYVVDKCVANYNRMRGQGIVLFINGSVGGTLACQKLCERDKIPQLHAGNMKASLYTPEGKPNKWVITPSAAYTDSFGAFLDWLAIEWAPANLQTGEKIKLGIITSDCAFGKSLLEPSTEAYMKQKGIEYLGMIFAGVSDIDMTPQVKEMAEKGANWIACNHVTPFASNLAKSVGRLGLHDRVHLFFNQACYDDVFVKMAGADAEGTWGVGFTGHICDSDPFNDRMRETIKDRYPRTTVFYQHGLGVVYSRSVEAALTSALEKHGYPITGENVADAIRSADGKGVWARPTPNCLIPGNFDCTDPKDAVMLHDVALLTCEQGKMKVVKVIPCPALSYR